VLIATTTEVDTIDEDILEVRFLTHLFSLCQYSPPFWEGSGVGSFFFGRGRG
jgi:hypothetical protein